MDPKMEKNGAYEITPSVKILTNNFQSLER